MCCSKRNDREAAFSSLSTLRTPLLARHPAQIITSHQPVPRLPTLSTPPTCSYETIRYSSGTPRHSQGIASDKPELSLWYLAPYQHILSSPDTTRQGTYILNSGSHTVTARRDTCPFARTGGSRKNCFSAEHSITRPYRVSSSRQRS